jgi:D-alanyl-D-alanine carboxypeptidase
MARLGGERKLGVPILALLLALAIAVPTAAAGAGGSSTVELDRATRSKLRQVFGAQVEKTFMPGVAAAVWIGDRRWRATHGVSDLETQAPFDVADNLRIASITKSFTGTAVLQLVKEGKLRLDDRLETFVPGIPNGDQITIRQLLGMRSGIFDFTADEGFVAAFDADPTMSWNPQQVVDIIKQHEPNFPPGTQTQYADSNYELLGIIIEQVTGRPAEEVINADVVRRLGLESTVFPTDVQVPQPHPTGYVPDPDDPSVPLRVVNDVNPKVAWTAGAMLSTVEDLGRWGEELTDGTLLTPRLQRARLRSHRFPDVPINAGYGLGVERINDLVGHNGAIYGYSTVVYRLPGADATFVVVGNASTNSTTPSTEIALELIKALYPEQVK